MYWNFPECNYINEKYIPSYKAYYTNKIFNNDSVSYLLKGITECHDFLTKLILFVNEVYLIESRTVESSVLPYIIYKDRNDSELIQNIIVSNDKYDLQYINEGFTILSPNGDNSKYITKQNVLQSLKDSLSVKTDMSITTNYLSFVLSILGNKYRNIQKITSMGLSGVIKQINKAKDNFLVTDSTSSIDMLKAILDVRYQPQFCINFRCTDIRTQYKEISELDRYNVLSLVEDKYDDVALLTIDEKYFQNHPLMLINTKREQLSNTRVNTKNIFDR